MTEQNCNPIAPRALPISTHPLADFDDLYILRSKPLESFFIAPPPERIAHEPAANVFRQPIQFVVLGVIGDEIQLGVYADPDLKFEQGPLPDEQWRRRWELECEHSCCSPASEPDTGARNIDPEKAFILDICDDLYDLQAAFQFFGITVKEILQTGEYADMHRKTKHGYAIVLDWVLEHGDNLLARLKQRLKRGDRES